MNLNSKYFDMIRASRHQGREEKRAQMVEDGSRCDWPDCLKAGDYPAPAGPQTKEKGIFATTMCANIIAAIIISKA